MGSEKYLLKQIFGQLRERGRADHLAKISHQKLKAFFPQIERLALVRSAEHQRDVVDRDRLFDGCLADTFERLDEKLIRDGQQIERKFEASNTRMETSTRSVYKNSTRA